MTVAPWPLQPLDRRERGSDAEVVGDLAAVERHVEVGAHQDALPVDVGQVFEKGELHRMGGCHWFAACHWLAAPTMSARSTSRFE